MARKYSISELCTCVMRKKKLLENSKRNFYSHSSLKCYNFQNVFIGVMMKKRKQIESKNVYYFIEILTISYMYQHKNICK